MKLNKSILVMSLFALLIMQVTTTHGTTYNPTVKQYQKPADGNYPNIALIIEVSDMNPAIKYELIVTQDENSKTYSFGTIIVAYPEYTPQTDSDVVCSLQVEGTEVASFTIEMKKNPANEIQNFQLGEKEIEILTIAGGTTFAIIILYVIVRKLK